MNDIYFFIKLNNDDEPVHEINERVKQIKIYSHPTCPASQIISDKPPIQLSRITWTSVDAHFSIEFHQNGINQI